MINIEEAISAGKNDKAKETEKNIRALEQHLVKSVGRLDENKIFQKIFAASKDGCDKVRLFRFYRVEKFWFSPSYCVRDFDQIFETFKRLDLERVVLNRFKTSLQISLKYEIVEADWDYDCSERDCGEVWLHWKTKEKREKNNKK